MDNDDVNWLNEIMGESKKASAALMELLAMQRNAPNIRHSDSINDYPSSDVINHINSSCSDTESDADFNHTAEDRSEDDVEETFQITENGKQEIKGSVDGECDLEHSNNSNVSSKRCEMIKQRKQLMKDVKSKIDKNQSEEKLMESKLLDAAEQGNDLKKALIARLAKSYEATFDRDNECSGITRFLSWCVAPDQTKQQLRTQLVDAKTQLTVLHNILLVGRRNEFLELTTSLAIQETTKEKCRELELYSKLCDAENNVLKKCVKIIYQRTKKERENNKKIVQTFQKENKILRNEVKRYKLLHEMNKELDLNSLFKLLEATKDKNRELVEVKNQNESLKKEIKRLELDLVTVNKNLNKTDQQIIRMNEESIRQLQRTKKEMKRRKRRNISLSKQLNKSLSCNKVEVIENSTDSGVSLENNNDRQIQSEFKSDSIPIEEDYIPGSPTISRAVYSKSKSLESVIPSF